MQRVNRHSRNKCCSLIAIGGAVTSCCPMASLLSKSTDTSPRGHAIIFVRIVFTETVDEITICLSFDVHPRRTGDAPLRLALHIRRRREQNPKKSVDVTNNVIRQETGQSFI
jgi:hypothetical protein